MKRRKSTSCSTRRLLAAFIAVVGVFIALPQLAIAAPVSVPGWYMYGTSLSALKSNAKTHGKYFAQHHPGGYRVMLLDFGAARKIDSDTWGAIDFSGTLFNNSEILAALKSAADGHHEGYVNVGNTDILYGNSNYHMSNVGMSTSDAWYAGYYQSQRSEQLANYQISKGYSAQNSDAASDMELSWDGQLITKQLVNGDAAQGWALYYNYGSADGCPSSGSSGSCNNGWDVGDVGYVSYSHLAVPLPEIYYTVNADQWTVVRRWWDNNNPNDLYFWGTTATPGVGLTAAAGWNALNSRNSGRVFSELVCISSGNC
jgi:hypothetical protein